MTTTLITCSCLGSQTIDAPALAKATGLTVPPPCHALCGAQIDRAAKAIEAGDAILCCTQEARTFDDLAAELKAEPLALVDLRDRAGWTADRAPTTPKMAALLAEAALPAPPQKAMDVSSEGLCLILGPADIALEAAAQLAPYLGVTVLLEHPPEDLPETTDFDVITGHLRRASGALGGLEITIDALRQRQPGGRGALGFEAPRDGGRSVADVIVDLRGGPALFPAPEKREGYLRADPAHPPAVAAAVMAASHLTGTFEKPLYVQTDPLACAHARAGQTGCTRCLDLCPTGAILPAGDHITIDPMICAGCGSCAAACPSEAVRYDAPPTGLIFTRIQTLARAYLAAGGTRPRLLVHDAHGAEMIRLAARHGDGLPADVIPMELPAIGAFGHAEALAALAAGFGTVALLPGPAAEWEALRGQEALTGALAGPGRLVLLDLADPDALSAALFAADTAPALAQPVRPLGSRRQITRQAARALHAQSPEGLPAAPLPLPEGAPYGAVLVETEACTLCLSCVSLCPSGALLDNPDRPQLRFQEDACLQCGICAQACPENAITLAPRLNLADTALDQVVLHDEPPCACIECGALFGVQSTVTRIMEKLRDHPMFDEDKLRLVQMCDNCRINAQYHDQKNPLAGPARPRPRSTQDYLSQRRDH